MRLRGAFFEAGPELRVPVLKHEYVLKSPQRTVYVTPAVTWGLMAGGGLQF